MTLHVGNALAVQSSCAPWTVNVPLTHPKIIRYAHVLKHKYSTIFSLINLPKPTLLYQFLNHNHLWLP